MFGRVIYARRRCKARALSVYISCFLIPKENISCVCPSACVLLIEIQYLLRLTCIILFQNVRERLGSVLTNIFLCDMEFGDADVGGKSSNNRCPKIVDFINEILPQLEIMAIETEQSTTPGTTFQG